MEFKLNGSKVEVAAGETEGARKATIGTMVWWTVSNAIVEEHQMKSLAGALESYLPGPISEANAFRLACSDIARSYKSDEDGVSYLIRDVADDADKILKRVVKEKRDEDDHLLYSECEDLSFYKKDGEYPAGIHVLWSDIGEQISKRYNLYSGRYDGSRIRRWIKNVIDSTHPTLIRPSGSVYFVPETHRWKVAALEESINRIDKEAFARLYQDSSTVFQYIDIIDSEKHKQMVFEAFISQTNNQVSRFMAELSEVLKGEKITPGMVSKYVNGLLELRESVAQYTVLLEKDLTVASTRMELVEEQIKQALERVEV